MIPDSLLHGDNAAFLDERYAAWLDDPQSVEPSLRALFDEAGRVESRPPSVRPRSIFASGAAAEADPRAARRQARVVQLVNAYRVRGHLDAAIDPLDRRERLAHPELTIEHWGLEPSDLDVEVGTEPVFGVPPRLPLRALVEHLRKTYCGSIGAEFMNITDTPQRRWVQEQLETLPNRGVLTPAEERRVFRKLCDAENFERMLHGRFPGTKRFSIEGAETVSGRATSWRSRPPVRRAR